MNDSRELTKTFASYYMTPSRLVGSFHLDNEKGLLGGLITIKIMHHNTCGVGGSVRGLVNIQTKEEMDIWC